MIQTDFSNKINALYTHFARMNSENATNDSITSNLELQRISCVDALFSQIKNISFVSHLIPFQEQNDSSQIPQAIGTTKDVLALGTLDVVTKEKAQFVKTILRHISKNRDSDLTLLKSLNDVKKEIKNSDTEDKENLIIHKIYSKKH